MSEFIVCEEAFKLRIGERVPSPHEGECFLLCQSGAGAQNSMLINYGVKYSSTEVRHGHYNQKITLSLEEKTFNQSYRVIMEDKDFCFDVVVKMSYALQDARIYFFESKMEEEDVSHIVRNAMRQQDRKWNMEEDIELQNSLQDEIEKELKQFDGVRFRKLVVLVTLEEAAKKMRDSNKKKTVGIHVSQNETAEKIARNEQAEMIADSEQKLKMKQINDMALMWQKFGNMGPIVDEYFKGNMDGKGLYDYIMRARSEKMSMLQTAVSGDMLTQKETMEKLNEIFANNDFLQTIELKQIPGVDVNKLEEKTIRDEDVVDDENPNGKEKTDGADQTERKKTLVDGDYIE